MKMSNKMVTGLLFAAATLLSTSILAADGRPVETIFEASCKMCHEQKLAGAPGLSDLDAWAPRFEAGIDAMTETVIKGKGAMPPRGTCFKCSDEELKAVVEHMVKVIEGN